MQNLTPVAGYRGFNKDCFHLTPHYFCYCYHPCYYYLVSALPRCTSCTFLSVLPIIIKIDSKPIWSSSAGMLYFADEGNQRSGSKKGCWFKVTLSISKELDLWISALDWLQAVRIPSCTWWFSKGTPSPSIPPVPKSCRIIYWHSWPADILPISMIFSGFKTSDTNTL